MEKEQQQAPVASEVMTVTRALAELKSLQDRIEKASNVVFIGVSLGSGDNMKGLNDPRPVDVITKEIVANYNSVIDLKNRRAKIKDAVMVSNSVTTVSIAGKAMTVMQAIERKHSIGIEKNLLERFKSQFSGALSATTKIETDLVKAITQMVSAMNVRENSDAAKENNSSLINAQQRAVSEPKLLDPNDLATKIRDLEENITSFETEVDYTLSVSNATTTIVVQ